jgi:ribosomal protein S18 acetylase RimI-like enzyme
VKVEATLTAGQPEADGFRVFAAGPREAGRRVAAVRRFHGESGRASDPAQAMTVHALCSDPSLGRAGVAAGGRARHVGCALAYWRHSIDHGGRVAVLDDLWIDAALRGRGLGRRLTEAVLADMSASGARAVVVEVGPADAPAMSFYARLGLAPKGTALLVRALPAAGAPLAGGS